MSITKPTILTLVYLGLAALWQYILWTVWPNVGMGGLAIVYLVWPLLFLSGLVLWFLFTGYPAKSNAIFALASAAMLLVTLSMHPHA